MYHIKNAGDRFGYVDWAFRGTAIPLAGSGTTNYISRDEDGIPTVVIHEGGRAGYFPLCHRKENRGRGVELRSRCRDPPARRYLPN